MSAPPVAGPVAEARAVRKDFPVESGILRRVRGHVQAVAGVDLAVPPGRTVGLVGESGSGKSTLARLFLRLIEPTAGAILFEGTDVTALGPARLRELRRHMQMVFQDPYSSLDPHATVSDSVAEPLRTHLDLDRGGRDDRVAELFRLVGLSPTLRNRYPREFSGGQLQRIAVARALAVNPKLVVLDEPVSSLDVSTQAEVVNLLADLQADLGLAYLFIAHDLAVVRHVSHRIAVMYLGRIVEEGDNAAVTEQPKHPYTQALLSAIPVPHPGRQRARERIVLAGDIPSPAAPPPGCRFHTRCPYVMDVCRHEDPPAFTAADGSRVHCHLHTHGPGLRGRSVLELRPAGRGG